VSHCPERASPAATEITYGISHIEQLREEYTETLRDSVPCLITADWHMRNPDMNHGLLSPNALFHLIKMGWLTLTDVRRHFNPYDYVALAHYNDKPDEQRYPFVVASQNEPIPTRSAYGYVVRLALPFIRTIIRIRYFADITLRDTRMMRERGREGLLPVPSCA
jgi:hypothetical protein